jgi:hypothetical protein
MKRYKISRLLAVTLVSASVLSASVTASDTFVIDPQERFDVTEGDYKGQSFTPAANPDSDAQNVGVQANVQNAVPEPATWLMLILGFAFIVVASSRRRKTIDQFS